MAFLINEAKKLDILTPISIGQWTSEPCYIFVYSINITIPQKALRNTFKCLLTWKLLHFSQHILFLSQPTLFELDSDHWPPTTAHTLCTQLKPDPFNSCIWDWVSSLNFSVSQHLGRFTLQVAMSVCLSPPPPCNIEHLRFKQAQPEICHFPKVEGEVEN